MPEVLHQVFSFIAALVMVSFVLFAIGSFFVINHETNQDMKKLEAWRQAKEQVAKEQEAWQQAGQFNKLQYREFTDEL